MATAKSPFWGGGNTSKDYLMMMAGTTPISVPKSLVGHGFSNFGTDQIDRVTQVGVVLERGRIREHQYILRPAVQTQVTFTIQFGSLGEAWTPLLARVRKGNCTLNLFMKRLCPNNDDSEHFYVMRDVIFDPVTYPNDLITVDDTSNVVVAQADAAAPEMLIVFKDGAFLVNNVTPPLYAVAIMTDACVDCEEGTFQSFVAAGGAGGASDEAYLITTEDRFTTITVQSTGIANGNSIKALYTDGDVILAGFAADPDPATALTGGTAISVDRGVSFVLDSNITPAIHGVGFFDGQYIAVGGVGAGGAASIFASDDGVSWTAVTGTAIPSITVLHALAVDVDNETMYVVGDAGVMLKVTKSGTAFNIVALTPTGVSTTSLNSVAVFGPDHVAVGGAGGYYAETFDGGDTWVNPDVPGSTNIAAIAGISYMRYIIGTTTAIAERSVLSDNNWKVKSMQAGVTITGDFTGAAMAPGDPDYSVMVTDDGEVVVLHPFYPGA